MDSLLKIEPEVVEARCVNFIRTCLKDAGLSKIVIGLSGGVDSSVVAALCVKAAGENNVLGLLMPYRTSHPSSKQDALRVAHMLGIRTETYQITPVVDAYLKVLPDVGRIRLGNLMARTRMAILFDTAKRTDALVAGTGNKTEYLLGYFTLFGDGAFSFAPIIGLYKTQVWELARYLGLPQEVIEKTPTADLWQGQTDEGELGITYAEADRILVRLCDMGMSVEEVVAEGFRRDMVEHVAELMRKTSFKRRGARLLRFGWYE